MDGPLITVLSLVFHKATIALQIPLSQAPFGFFTFQQQIGSTCSLAGRFTGMLFAAN
jgi:hypothetical protein